MQQRINAITKQLNFGLTELSFFINGTRYPQQKLVGSATNFAEFSTEACLSNGALANIYHNSHINITAPSAPIVQAVATGTGANDAADEEQATANGSANLLRNQAAVNCRNYEHLAGELAASFYASPTAGSAATLANLLFLALLLPLQDTEHF